MYLYTCLGSYFPLVLNQVQVFIFMLEDSYNSGNVTVATLKLPVEKVAKLSP